MVEKKFGRNVEKNGQLNFLVKKEMLSVTRGLCMLYSQWTANLP